MTSEDNEIRLLASNKAGQEWDVVPIGRWDMAEHTIEALKEALV